MPTEAPVREDSTGSISGCCAVPSMAGAGARLAPLSLIQALQLRKIRVLLEAVLATNPFYAEKLSRCALNEELPNLQTFASKVPFTTKHELIRDRLANPPYGTNLTYPLECYVRCHQTSGSTTTVPIRWLDTEESWNHLVQNWVDILNVAGVRRADRFFFAFSFGPFLGFWSALEAAMRLHCFIFPGGAMSSLARVHAILDNGITILCCTPTYAQHLGEVAREKQVDLSSSRLRLIIVAGESGGSIPATRARLERLWPGAAVFDHHGMTEVGPVTYQCPSQPGVLHVLESAYLPEVIDPHTGLPSAPGTTGELVLTTLDRIGSPLFRFRTGDLVKPRPRSICVCGREELALQGGIIGRTDDMVIVRGVNVYPSLMEEIVRSFPQVSEYRVTVDDRGPMAELLLEIECDDENTNTSALERRIQEAIHTALHLRIPVRTLPPSTLPRFEMKARRWVRAAD